MKRQDIDHTAPTTVKVAETKFGKNISISRCKNGRMFQIDVSGGGVKPPVLDGQFTRYTEAQAAIKFYVDSNNLGE